MGRGLDHTSIPYSGCLDLRPISWREIKIWERLYCRVINFLDCKEFFGCVGQTSLKSGRDVESDQCCTWSGWLKNRSWCKEQRKKKKWALWLLYRMTLYCLYTTTRTTTRCPSQRIMLPTSRATCRALHISHPIDAASAMATVPARNLWRCRPLYPSSALRENVSWRTKEDQDLTKAFSGCRPPSLKPVHPLYCILL